MKHIFTTIFAIALMAHYLIAQNALLIPDTLSGSAIDLTLQRGTHQFFTGTATSTMGANGNILGPTLILQKGEFVNLSVENQIGETTTIHWHGLHVSPENDGGPHTTIAPGEVWRPAFTVLDDAATYWYHPHLHTKTNEHVSKGIAGMIIVRDDVEAALDLPRRYGVDDFPVVIQTKDFDNNNQIVVPSNADDVLMVNATLDPLLDVPAQVVRFRLLNGSSMRVFRMGLTGNRTFYQITSDGGLLSQPLTLTRLELAPGERAEILVNLTGMEGQTIALRGFASEFPNGIYGATNPGMGNNQTLDGYNPNPLNGADFDILTLNIVAPTASAITAIPAQLRTLSPIPESSADLTREFNMRATGMGPTVLNGDFTFNNQPFDLDVINYVIKLDNTEIWSITNNSPIAHPFHIHDVQFYVLDRDGATPPPTERGKKDVILIKPMETVRFITRFEDFASDEVPYMYHCHMLYHEDRGMMGQFKVVDNVLGTNDELTLTVYPNPANESLTVRVPSGEAIEQIRIFDINGRLIYQEDQPGNTANLQLDRLSKGLHLISVSTGNKTVTKQIILK